MGNVIFMVVVGAVAGWLAALLVKGEGFGLVGNVAVGIAGAVLAGLILPQFGWGGGPGRAGFLPTILQATLGAVVLLVLVRVVKRL
jgi:uncharacterized membrane protein YeaQ/YmgE (transglycosylase-associated protein family)